MNVPIVAGVVLAVAGLGLSDLHAQARIIGEPTNGCIADAADLPLEGRGYTVMHLERNRHFGHPALIRTVTELAHDVQQGGGHLRVGDLSLMRGGPMPFGHHSHQTGLDADLWFDLEPTLKHSLNPMRSNVSATRLLDVTGHALDNRLWSDRQEHALKAAALIAGVDRVFVNPLIKRRLCQTSKGDRSWLRRIRPWYGHDDHFHLRLACPENSPECIPQASVPSGEGCDASLEWWFQRHPPETGTPATPKPPLPTACVPILK